MNESAGSTIACTIGWSRPPMLSTASRPTPGQKKIVSVMIAPR